MNSQRQSISSLLVILLTTILTLGACNNDVNEELRPSISTFITRYFPMESVQTYTENSNGTYTVIIHNGTEILFDANQEWTSISGRGNTLPEVLIEDQCPSPLVQYITEMEFLDQVYELSRTNNSYHVVFLNTYIDYSTDDGKITYPQK
ncbi:MAG: hypothetical protein HDS08_07375 [Bacteroides sp.]|nr:hypothetical protein [Barnesiella sp.]MBD5315956.1 hypothetical protein [Bacteroides sp.]